MTIRHLKVFIKVAELESISKCAEELMIAQPSVSQTIKELEHYYNVTLFNRNNRKLTLTKEGLSLLNKAKRACSTFDEFEYSAKQEEMSKRIKIGATLTFGMTFIPGFTKTLKENIPNVDPYIYIDKTDGLERKIINGDLDFAITEGQTSDDNISSIAFGKDRLICVASIDYDVPNKISIQDLDKYDFIRREKGSASRKILDSVLLRRGIKIFNPRMESVSNASIIAMVKANQGIALLPRELVQTYLENNTFKSIELDETLERKLSVIIHKNKKFTKVGKLAYSLCLEKLNNKNYSVSEQVSK